MTSPPLNGLVHRREFAKLTQRQLSEVVGVSQSQYNKFEKGLVRLDVHRADKLARHLDCKIEDLL